MAVLILGGTQEARELKAALGDRAILALARTTRFGGAEGLKLYVKTHGITTIVDATHPFATNIAHNATQAGVRVIRLERPGFLPESGDQWTYVDHLEEAALPADARVFLTTGHHELEVLEHHPAFFLVRALTRPRVLPARHTLVLAQGPFDLADELALIEAHRLTHLVTKDSGGPDAKLRAARRHGLQVTLIRRPRRPPADVTVTTSENVLLRLSD